MVVAQLLAVPLLQLELRPQLLLKLEPIILQLIQIALRFKWQLHQLVELLQELQRLVLRL